MATIFVTRSRSFSWCDKPGNYLLCAFCLSQAASTFLGVYGLTGQYPLNGESMFGGCGWGWALVAWLWSLCFYFPLDILKFFFRAAVDRRWQSVKSIFNLEREIIGVDGRDALRIRNSFEEPKGPPSGGMTAGNAPTSVS